MPGGRLRRVSKQYDRCEWQTESNPTESERIIGLVEDPEQRANAIVSLCPKLAIADLARARRLAATITDPTQRAAAEGELAKAIATTNPSVAKECVQETLRLLAVAAGNAAYLSIDEAESAAALLPMAELVAPQQMEEFFWQTISLAHSDQQLSLDGAYQVQVTSAVAAFVARYDREAARLLLGQPETVLGMLSGVPARRPLRAYTAFFAALTSIDPTAVPCLLDNVPDQGDEGGDDRSPRDAARRAIVRLLASQGESRLRALKELVGIPDYVADDF